MAKYAIGVDYGSLSGRTVLVDVMTGKQVACAVYEYPHGVMDTVFLDGSPLGNDWALQHPQDYLEVLYRTIPAVLKQSAISPQAVIGIGVDVTACTILPVKKDGTPLCFLQEYQNRPHAYIKLWKHHAAQDKANRIGDLARARGEIWLKDYGGRISSEWLFPKIWQLLEEDPQIYDAMDSWVEAADWIVWQLTGVQTRNACAAGYKGLWNKKTGYPSRAFFRELHPKLEYVVEQKLSGAVVPVGTTAGYVTAEAAKRTGLRPGTPVSVGNVDAHVCVPAAGIDTPGKLLAIMGTSACHMVMAPEKHPVSGICGVVEDGILPGYFGYEAGQPCVGDCFAWMIKNTLPQAYFEQAKIQNKNIHQYLREKAVRQRPGQSGLLALDWWNGNRSVLVDADLTGMILGMNLQTKPEEIYRALIEATAYGTRVIVENYRENGIPVEEFYASGGIPQKDPMTMQIYADVLNVPVRVVSAEQGPALGSAIFGAVAAGEERGGYRSVSQAIRAMGGTEKTVYYPVSQNAAVYDRLFREYRSLYEYFGCGGNEVMKRLKVLKNS